MSKQFYFSEEHIFTTRSADKSVVLKALDNILHLSGSVQINSSLLYVLSADNFPEPVSGVITLEDNRQYIILGSIDLLGNRIVCGVNTILSGLNSEISNLTSTGLGTGVPFITSQYTLNITNITIHDVDTCFSMDGGADPGDPTPVCDWTASNFENIPVMGTITNYANFIFDKGAIINSAQFTFAGNHGTISFQNSIWTNFNDTTSLIIDSTANITGRMKIIESSMVTTGTGVSIDFSVSATVPNQGYVLTSVNFSGSSTTYLTGVSVLSNKSLFFKCIGISNSRSTGSFYINATAFTTLVVNVWKKLGGTTSGNPNNSKFTATNNRLTYDGTITQVFLIVYSVTLAGMNGNDIQAGVSLNGADPEPYTVSAQTTDSGGKIGYQGASFTLELSQGDYIEIFVKNTTASNGVDNDQMTLTVFGGF